MVIILPDSAFAEQKLANFLNTSKRANVLILQTWRVGNSAEIELKALVRENDEGGYKLEIYKTNKNQFKKIYDFQGSLPGSISQFDDKLVVLWGTAVGFLINVFEFKNGKVQMIIDDGSYLPPEYVYLGKNLKPAFIIANLEWIIDAKGGREKIPTTANVYIFENGKLIQNKNVPWAYRYLM